MHKPPTGRMHGFLEAHVGDYMTHDVRTVAPQTPLSEIERQFGLHDFNGFPVVDAGRLVGMLTKFDVLKVFMFTPRTVVPAYDEISRRTAEQIMTRNVITFSTETPLPRVLQTLVDFRVKSFPVVDGDELVGIIAREDIVRALHEHCG
jgi:CBS domain-containing protein